MLLITYIMGLLVSPSESGTVTSSCWTNSSLVSHGNVSSAVYDNVTESVSGDDNLLLMCPHDSIDRCYSAYAWKYLLASINLTSIVVNIFHAVILSKLRSMRGTPYRFVLQQMTVADIYATLPSFRIFCFYHSLYYGKHIMVGVIFATIHDHCALMRYNVLAAASIERYLAICRPLGGKSSCVRTWSRAEKVKLTSAIFWVAALVFVLSKNYFFRNDLCIWALYGPATLNSRKSTLYLLIYMIAQTAVIVVTNIKVLRELNRVTSQNLPRSRMMLARRTVYYITIINIAFYMCLVPSVVLYLLGPFGIPVATARWIINVFYSCYGIFNVFIYRWLMKPYMTYIFAIFSCGIKNASQHPASKKTTNVHNSIDKQVHCQTCQTSSDEISESHNVC